MRRGGDRRHLTTIRAPLGVLDKAAAVDVATGIYTRVEVLDLPFQEREHLGLGGLQTAVIYALFIDYRTDVRPSFVLVEESCCPNPRTWQIVTIVPTDRRDELKLTCITKG